MPALTTNRALSVESWTTHRFPLASGEVAYQGGLAALDLATGNVVPASEGAGQIVFGTFSERVDATAGSATVNVRFADPIEVTWFANGSSISASDVGSLCFVEDDQTVSTAAAGRPVAGRIWAVEGVRGVAVQILSDAPPVLVESDPGAFVAGDLAIGDNPRSGAVYSIPTTSVASTVTLPAVAVEGTELTFVADGTENADTVQYQDSAGALTAALPAAQTHMVKAVFINGAWAVIAYVSP